nr:hypothetical protein [Tanacetum cinerariifolium]
MTDLQFVDQHNMVACLERTDGNIEFHQIVDFLTSSTIHYALTISRTIYASYIEQFWATVRSDLHFNNEDGITCLSNDEIFKNLALMGYERVSTFQKAFFSHQWKRNKRGQDTKIPHSSGPPKKVGDEAVYTGEDDRVIRAATTAASLEAEQESGNINKTQPMTTLTEPSLQGTGLGSGPRRHVTTLGDKNAQTRFETASKLSHDPPLSKVNTFGSGEDSMEHQDELMDFVPPIAHDSPLLGGHTPGNDKGRPNINELINLCTQLSNRVLALEQLKTVQDLKKTSDKENVSKQRRDESNKIEELNLSDKGSRETKVFDYTTAAEKDVNAAEPVSTAGDAVNGTSVIPDVSAAGPSRSVAGPSTKEPRRATPPLTVQSQDKGKGKMVEPEPISKNPIKAQIQRDAEIAQRLFEEEQAQFEREQKRKRFFATQRDEQNRNKPPTQAQLRNKMEWINDFVPMDSKEVNDSKQQAKSSKKRSRADHDKESVKKQKLEEDDAKKELTHRFPKWLPVRDGSSKES